MDIRDMLDKEDIEQEVARYTYRAYCTSIDCCTKVKKLGKHGVVKMAPRTTVWCLDCGEALFWDRTKC